MGLNIRISGKAERDDAIKVLRDLADRITKADHDALEDLHYLQCGVVIRVKEDSNDD